MSDGFTKATWKIPSVTPEWNLDAWCYLPDQHSKPCPVIIMAHGFSANKLMSLAPYAEAFAKLGYAAVVFDYRRWGASDGQPRNCLYVSEQLEDYRTVIKYCRQRSEFDPQRVILWGTSFAGGHAVKLASEADLNILAAISQCPYLGAGLPLALNYGFIMTSVYAILDRVKQMVGLAPIYIPGCAKPGKIGGLTTPGTYEDMHKLVRDPSDYPNQVSASSMLEFAFYKPIATVGRIACPVLIVGLEHDNLCLINGPVDAARASDNVELLRLDGAHFDPYPGMPFHEESLSTQLTFLQKHVPP
ncbi:alpha/beta-hydrolase [Sparassis latifolia]